jgi:hypothetical protein
VEVFSEIGEQGVDVRQNRLQEFLGRQINILPVVQTHRYDSGMEDAASLPSQGPQQNSGAHTL